MKNNTTQKAVVAKINYAGFEFPGLKLPNGEYAIALSQIVDLLQRDNKGFRPSKNTAARDFKRMLGERFRSSKIATEIDNAKFNIVDVKTFGLLMVQSAIKGNKVALAITEASVTTTIEQAFDIAFDNKQKLEDYQAKQAARVQGKLTRRSFTTVVKDYVIAHSDKLSDNYKTFIYNNCTDATYRLVFGRSAKKLKEAWQCRDVRDELTIEEAMIIDSIERLAATLIDEQGFEPQEAIKEAGRRMLIKAIGR